MKTDKFLDRMRSQAGQATLEYVLLMFIVLGVCTGVLLKFSREFKKFGEAIVGEQLRCALETGQFPDALPSGTCGDADFNPQYGSAGSGAGGAGGAAGSGSSNSSSSTSNQSGSGSGSDSSDSGGGGGGGGGAAGSDGISASGGGRGKRMEAGNGGKGGGGKDGDGDDSGAGALSGRSRSVTVVDEVVRVGDGSNSRYIPIVGSETGQQTATNKEPLAVKGDGVEMKSSKKIPVVVDDRKPTAAPPDEPMSFGKFLKYLIIGAMILALIVFFGGQIMNFQKSKE